nr:hypothetical protein [Tanacetum cinerariifolium]
MPWKVGQWRGNQTTIGEEPYHDIRPTLQRLPFYCTPPATDVVMPEPTLEDVTARNPTAKEEPYHDIRPTLQRLPFYCTPPAADVVMPEPTLEDVTASNPTAKTNNVKCKHIGGIFRPISTKYE